MKVKIRGKWYALVPTMLRYRYRRKPPRPLTAAQKRERIERNRRWRKIEQAYTSVQTAQLRWAQKMVALEELKKAARKAALRRNKSR